MQANINTIAGGVIPEKFEVELQKVLDNISDMKTSSKAAREITINVKITPNEGRDQTKVDISVKSKLAPARPAETFMYLVFTEDGVSASTTDPKQHELFDIKQAVPPAKEFAK